MIRYTSILYFILVRYIYRHINWIRKFLHYLSYFPLIPLSGKYFIMTNCLTLCSSCNMYFLISIFYKNISSNEKSRVSQYVQVEPQVWAAERTKTHFYKINGNLNSTMQKNIINDHKYKTNSLLCNINIHKIN